MIDICKQTDTKRYTAEKERKNTSTQRFSVITFSSSLKCRPQGTILSFILTSCTAEQTSSRKEAVVPDALYRINNTLPCDHIMHCHDLLQFGTFEPVSPRNQCH